MSLSPRTLEGWTATLRQVEIPILRQTRDELLALKADEDRISPADVAVVVQGDPLATLKVLATASRLRSRRVVTDAETITTAVVLMGLDPLFACFEGVASVEELLGARSPALEGLNEVIGRARRAAQFALAFAVHRVDTDAEVLQEAALLHDFTEMLLWCHSPQIALEGRQRLRDTPGLRTVEVQRALLGVELRDVQRELLQAWRLPEIFAQVSDRRHADQARVRTVRLAVDLARHTQRGWDNPALTDDFAAIAQLLNVGTEYAMRLVRRLDD